MAAGRGRRLPATERRAQIIEVGRAAFSEHGFEATSMEGIADRAKVSKPIVYEHFRDKEGLYAVVVDREMEYVVRRISEAIASGSMRERVERAALVFLTYVKEQPEGFAILSQDSPLTSSRGRRLSSMLNELAERVGAVFAATFQGAGFDPGAAPIYAHGLVGMATFIGKWWTETNEGDVEDVARHLSALAWAGLRKLPRRPTR